MWKRNSYFFIGIIIQALIMKKEENNCFTAAQCNKQDYFMVA